jgi:predicted GTPase
MAKKVEEPKVKELTIDRMFGYKIIISKNGYEVSWDQENENNLAALAISDQLIKQNIEMVKEYHATTHSEKVAKRDRLDRLKKLNNEIVNCMAEVAEYLLGNKTQEEYDLTNARVNGKKSKIVTLPEKKIIIPGK